MIRVKICGITSAEDIQMINRLQPDYAGFVFANSPRRLTLEKARDLTKGLGTNIQRVGVFVNEYPQVIERFIGECGLDVIQLHGDEGRENCYYPGVQIWKALRIRDAASLQAMEKYDVDAFVLDTFVQDSYGGTGRSFDWDILHPFKGNRKIFLAGGLTPENVELAIQKGHPYGVDVSSGVEIKGKKDFAKMEKFISSVRRAESKQLSECYSH